MKTKIIKDTVFPTFPKELEENFINLESLEQIAFKDIEKNAKAILVPEKFLKRYEGFLIFPNSLVNYIREFEFLGSDEQSGVYQAELYANNEIYIYNKQGEIIETPSMLERFRGLKTEKTSFDHHCFYLLNNTKTKRIWSETLVVPIYEGNQDYEAIMKHIIKTKCK